MKVGAISYVNTTPFFHDWPVEPFELLQLPPRPLAEAAEKGDVIAGPLPITECWRLEKEFEPLDNFGIAVKDASRSVYLLSRLPLSHLNNKVIGVTNDSSASVRLLQVLTGQRYAHKNQFKRGLNDDDDAWLVIGNQALQFWRMNSPQWACVTDLATEWWSWKKLPFVFARWVVRRDLEPEIRQRLADQVKSCLEKGLGSLRVIAEEQEKKLGIPAASIKMYLEGFRYVFGEQENKSEQLFRKLAEKVEEVKEVVAP